MIFGFLTLFIALAIAGVAGWFSIVGLMAIFSASAIPIAIMAGTLEIGKLIAASWLYRYWDTAKWWLKTYLTLAVLVLMLITSMGIFGYLSKAHLDQTAVGGNNQLKMSQIQLRIDRETRKITDASTVISQLDQTVQTLMDYDRIRGPEGALAVRESQAAERETLNSVIDTATDQITQYQEQLLPLQQSQIQVELKVGPLKYVAELIYGESGESTLDKAVRLFIILLVVVFDPLAIIMIIAANQTLLRYGIDLEKSGPDTVSDTQYVEVEKIVEVPVEVIKEVEKIVEVEVIKEVEKIVEVEKPVEIVKAVEKIVEVEKLVEDNNKVDTLTAEVDRLVKELQQEKAKQPDARDELREAAAIMANSELNKEDLSESEIYDMLQKTSEEDVKRKLGFWAVPLPKDDNDLVQPKKYLSKKR